MERKTGRGRDPAPETATETAPAVAQAEAPGATLCRVVLPGHVRVVDEDRREIELCATSEAVDSYGTVFSYEASKDAFARWAGNVREMHERKAVGRKVALRFDDEARKVYARVRISKGAGDTWEKVKDGTLSGASIGASNVEWRTQRVAGREVPVARRYDLVELSLVDLASNPDAQGVAFVRTLVRDALPDAALLDDVGETEKFTTEGTEDTEERGTSNTESTEVHREDRETVSSPRSSASSVSSALDVEATCPAADLRHSRSEAPSRESIAERDGSLSTEDPAAAIAAVALARGLADLTPRPPSLVREGGEEESTAKQARLAALGAPDYAHAVTRAHDTEERGTSNAEITENTEGRREDREIRSSLWSSVSSVSSVLDAGPSFPYRAQGPYSRDPEGPADAGTPARVPGDPTPASANGAGNEGHPALDGVDLARALRAVALMHELLAALGPVFGLFGLVRPMDRDGHPVAADLPPDASDDGASTGQSDVSQPADGWAGRSARGGHGGEERNTSNPANAETRGEVERAKNSPRPSASSVGSALDVDASVSSVPSVVSSAVDRVAEGVYRRLAGQLGDIEARLARIEAQPMPGGPILRTADKTSPLAPHGGSGGQPGAYEQYRALESLAGRLSDPQAQVAVAAEMIRLQQEAAGLPPAMQVMPRAGRGWERP